jgi:hypothetical protein
VSERRNAGHFSVLGSRSHKGATEQEGKRLLLWGWNLWSYIFPVGRSRFLSAGTACSGDSSRGGDAWAGEGGATGALLWWTLEDLFKRSGYNINFNW